jgi:hypothetical protein
LFIRLVASLALLFGLSSSLLALSTPVLAAQATAETGANGLDGDTSYTSPQFGYAVTWGSPWETRARNVSSEPGGFDALTLRDGDSTLRVTGRAAGGDPAAVLEDAIKQVTSPSSSAVVVSKNTGTKPFGAVVTIAGDTVQIEVQDLLKNNATVVIVLDTPTTSFDALLATTKNVVKLNGIPVLAGVDAGTAVATPEAATPQSATPEATAIVPTPTEVLAPTKSPTEAPVATTAATEAATPAGPSGVDGDTYTSPHFGYTFTWSASTWQVQKGSEISQDDPAYDMLGLSAKTGDLYVYAWAAYDGDAGNCLKGEASYYKSKVDGVSGWKVAADADGNPISDVSANSAWGVYNLTYTDPSDANAKPQQVTDYIECRPLVDGKSVIVIFASAQRSSYNDHIDSVQKVIDTIDTSKVSEPGGDGTPVGQTETPGLVGSTFTSPSFAFTLEIPSDWSLTDATIKRDDETLVLSDGISNVTLRATDDSTYTGSLKGCVGAAVADAESDSTYADLAIDTTVDGTDFSGSDSTGAYANYTYTDAAGVKNAHFIECSYISKNDSVLIVTQDVPYDQYASERGARRELQDAIVLP